MIQLRVRTEFSFKTAFGPIKRVAAALKELDCKAAGIVDSHGTWGHVKWASACNSAGVSPLFGTEIIVPQPDGRRPVCWILARDTRAFYQLSTAARREGADIPALLRAAAGKVYRFAGAALTDPDLFDFVDINPASPIQQMAALKLAKETGKPLVATSDNFYPLIGDKSAFLAMGGRERSTPQHILNATELSEALRTFDAKQFAKAKDNAAEIADQCAHELKQAPLIQVPGNLRKVVEAGRKRRLKLGHLSSWPKEYEARLQRELKVIEEKRYESYFLVVSDLVQWAKERMLVGPGRGSSAGSLLCYLVAITEVDPIPNGLLFERFLDINRGGWKLKKEFSDHGPFPPSLEAEAD